MANRYSTIVFSQLVAAGLSASFAKALPVNACNIVKIKVTPSIAAAPSEFFIYKDLTYAAADLVYATKAFTGYLIDPVEDQGASAFERNEGFVCAYEDKQSTNAIYFKIKNNHGVAVTYSCVITYDPNVSGSDVVVGAPDSLRVYGKSVGTTMQSSVEAGLNSSTIDQAEFRALFIAAGSGVLLTYDMSTVAEGGTFADNGTTQRVVTGNYANKDGSIYLWTYAPAGTWFIVWRVHNASGWSLWSDGNAIPTQVKDFFRTDPTVDIGSPSGWSVTLERGSAANTVICRADRPPVNGNVINFFAMQLLDADVGSWKTLLEGSDVGHLKHNGQLISYSLGPNRNTLIDALSGGFGTAAGGDLVLIDVRGGAWDEQYCQWATVYSVSASTLTLTNYIFPQVSSDLRLIIVKPPWLWSSGGYLGGTAAKGYYPKAYVDVNKYSNDKDTRSFASDAILIPNTVVNPEARVWFENSYCRADNNLTHSTGLMGLPTVKNWTNLNDKTWFIQMFGKPAYASQAFDGSGKLVVTAIDPQPAARNYGTLYGLKTRFYLYPDASGVLKIRAKFSNVTIPQGTDSQHRLGLFTGFIDRRCIPATQWRDRIVFWHQDGTAATIRFDTPLVYNVDGIYSWSTGVNYINVARPSPGYSLEILMGLGEDSAVGYDYGLILAQYRLNGGAWLSPAALDSTGPKVSPATGGQFLFGIIVPSGAVNPNSGWSATIDEFEVVQGIIAQNRIR